MNQKSLDKNKTKELCKCGKPLLICPKYCSKCGEGTMGNKKLVVIGDVKPKELEWGDKLEKLFPYGLYTRCQPFEDNDQLVNGLVKQFIKQTLTQQRTELLEEIKDLQTYVLFNDTEKLISLEEVKSLLNKKYE